MSLSQVGTCFYLRSTALSSHILSPQGIYPGPNGRYLYGTDTNGPAPTYDASNGWYLSPYPQPSYPYGFYVGEMGVFQQVGNQYYGGNCSGVGYYNLADANAANYDSSRIMAMGSSEYYMLAGPGVSNGAGGDYQWGAVQADWVLSHLEGPNTNHIIWADVERGPRQGNIQYTNGWNNNGSQCGVVAGGNPLFGNAQDRATFNGFWDTITNAGYTVGVYSSGNFWNPTFGSYENIPGTLEWTYEASLPATEVPSLGNWCYSSNACAQFFGGQYIGYSRSIAWQYSNGGADYDESYWGPPQ